MVAGSLALRKLLYFWIMLDKITLLLLGDALADAYSFAFAIT